MDPLLWIENQGIALMSARGPVPSLAEAIAGEPIRGSWWAHPRSHAILTAGERVTSSPDVLVCKLVQGKVTLVHRRLWPALVALALADEVGPERLARVDQEHTSSGKHVNRLTAMTDWVNEDVHAQAASLSPEAARRALGPLVAAILPSENRNRGSNSYSLAGGGGALTQPFSPRSKKLPSGSAARNSA